eukprot:538054-Rhodomonas_salina.2
MVLRLDNVSTGCRLTKVSHSLLSGSRTCPIRSFHVFHKHTILPGTTEGFCPPGWSRIEQNRLNIVGRHADDAARRIISENMLLGLIHCHAAVTDSLQLRSHS